MLQICTAKETYTAGELQSFRGFAGLVKSQRIELRHKVAGARTSKVFEDIKQLAGETGDVSKKSGITLTVGALQSTAHTHRV